MGTIALKLTLTPLLILAASLAGRRWGQAVAGWLVALPLTTGPVTFFLAIEQGTAFAARTAAGAIGATAAEACFCLAYGFLAGRGAGRAFLAGSLAFALAGALIVAAAPSLAVMMVMAPASFAIALWLMPQSARAVAPRLRSPAWDLPLRMLVATSIVLLITSLAPFLGARLSALLSAFPVFGSVLAVFAHHQQGPAAARQVLQGLLAGLYAFIGFCLALALSIERFGILAGFLAGGATALLVQGSSLWLITRRERALQG